jgi:DNA invertase Pin-like site-specific DNA recombinase
MGRKAKRANVSVAIGYIRCSTTEQELSPDAQRAALTRWANAQGVELVGVFEDVGVSGGTVLEKRPGLLAALDALRTTGSGVLLIAKRDRLARDVVVAAMAERLVERTGARVVSADGTGLGDGPEAVMMRGIQDLFAMYERLVIKARTRAALSVKRARGERVGQVPYGFRVAADGVTLELMAENVPARGARWHLTRVFEICRRGA